MSVSCTCCMLFAIVLLAWSLHTHCEQWQHFQSVALTLAAGQIELAWVQNGPVRFVQNNSMLNYQELLKKRPSLVTFCTQSVIQGLMVIYFKHS